MGRFNMPRGVRWYSVEDSLRRRLLHRSSSGVADPVGLP
jgi:hypothetical protein